MPSRNFLSASIPAWVFGFGLRVAASASHETPWRIPRKRTPPARISAQQQFFVGINDPLGGNPTNAPFTPVIFTLYGAWLNLTGQGAGLKASIARGEQLFNSRTIHITGVAGLNDDLGVPDITGSCGTCHDTPNFGNHSLPVPLNIGVGDLRSPLDVSYLPVITLRNKTTGQTVNTTDPGRALIQGTW